MKNIFLIPVILLLFQLGCLAQETQTRNVSGFDKLQISGAVDVVYSQSDSTSLTVKGKSGDLEKLESVVENGILIIRNKGQVDGAVTVYLKHNRLNELEVSGASDFKTTNVLTGDQIKINASGSSNVTLKTEIKDIKSQQSGASSITLKGTAESLEAELGGAGSLKAFSLTVKNASVTATGASTAKVQATHVLRARATGASDIKVKGEPAEMTAEAGSAANISRLKESSKHEGGADTIAYNWNKKKFLWIEDREEEERKRERDEEDFKHWRGFSMAVNGYLTPSGSISMTKEHHFMELNYANSFNYQLNLIERQFNLSQNHVKLITGFGFDFHQYEFDNRTILDPDTSYTWGSTDASGVTYMKNKFNMTYLQVPLLLEFNTNNDPAKTFHFALGVVGQYRIASRTKQKYEDGTYEYKKVDKGSYNLSPFAVKAHVNLGYRAFTVFAEYSLTPLFQINKGPELYPGAVGIRLVPFS